MKNKLVSISVLGVWMGAGVASAQGILPMSMPGPSDNPTTPEKVELGRKLYFEKRLSKTGEISCNSCHAVDGSGTDGQQFSTGINGLKGGRNAPTVWNAGFASVQFWDGRAASLEDQAKGPMVNPVEMGMVNHDAVVAVLRGIPEYKDGFKRAFGPDAEITIDLTAKAIAAFERTLVSGDSDYDRFAKGNQKAMSASAQRGWKLVQSVGCLTCHSGAGFQGPPLPVGVGFYQKFPVYPDAEIEAKYGFAKDLGRFEVTKKDEDKNRFRVPTWRNVARTAPYFHNGSVAKLDEAVRIMAKTQLNKTLKPNEVGDIVAFLGALNGRSKAGK